MLIDLDRELDKANDYNEGEKRKARTAIRNEINRLEGIEADVGFHKQLIQERNQRIANLELELEIANLKAGSSTATLNDLKQTAGDMRWAIHLMKEKEELEDIDTNG